MQQGRYNNTYDVVIVGAGAAGIACVKELVSRGYKDVLCIEALDEPGGRVKFNRKFGDIGGMCLHLPNRLLTKEHLHREFWGAADLVDFARKNDYLFYRESHKPKFRLYKNGQRVKESVINSANASIENALRQTIRKINRKELPADISLQDALAELLDNDICRSLISTIYSSTDTGLDAADISVVDYSNTMPSNPGLFPVDGMGPLLAAYARPYKNYFALNKEVVHVGKDGNLHKLTCTDTETGASLEILAHTLVITVSVGVLQSWIKDRKITLAKEKVQAIKNIKMSYLNKNILVMDKKFFRANGISSFTHINIRSNRLSRDANFLAIHLHGQYYLINFVGGKKSLRYEKKGTAFARTESLQILASVFGPDVYDFCIDSYLSHWNSHPHFLGAYSAATKNNYRSRLELSKPLAPAVFCAGEQVRYHTEEISLHTHISGALQSGIMAANQVIQHLER